MTIRNGPEVEAPEAARTDYRTVLEAIRGILVREYGVRRVTLRAIHSEASRFSVPIKVSGSGADGRSVRYFAKLLGNQDVLSEWIAQFAKNIYLQLGHQDPLFGYARNAEEMAREEYDGLLAIYNTGIPTAKPLGYHPLAGGMWLFVAEFLTARPVGDAGELTPAQIEELFEDVSRLHLRGVFHGDIKLANILVGDRLYLVDAGVFREGVPPGRKTAYDLACLVGTLLERHSPARILRVAARYYSPEVLRGILEFTDLIQKRQDFHFDDRRKEALRECLTASTRRSTARATGGRPRAERGALAQSMAV